MERPLHFALSHLTPDSAIVLLTLGIFLIYLELNRPGRILPGALGLLLTLLAMPPLHAGFTPILLLTTAAMLLALQLRRATNIFVSAAATLALILGFILLPSNAKQAIHIVISIACGLILGAGTSVLTRIARRARTNKGLD